MNRHLNIWVLYGGYGNLGDEAIFLGTLSVFKNVNGIEKVKLIDIYPEMPKKLNSFSVEYVNTGMLLGSREKRALRYSYAPFQLALLHVCKRAGLKGLLWHRGSSGYDSYHGSRLLVESAISASAIASRFLYRVLGGLSMGFTRNGLERKILQKFLNIWDFVLLREPYSLYYVRDLVPSKNKVLVVHDFAIHVDRSETEQSRRVKDTVKHLGKGSLTGVILRDYYYQYYYPKWYRVKYLRFIKDLANALAKREHKVILIPFSYLGDRENDIRFYWELKAERIVDDDVRILSEVINLTPSEVIDVLSVFNYIISVRTHGFILASLSNVPTIHLYYEHKGKGIAKYTFGVEGWSLSSCLREENVAERIVKCLENTNNKTTYEVLKARRHNEKIIHEIFNQLL